MNWILKNKNKSRKAVLIVLFLVFSFSKVQKVQAEMCLDTLYKLNATNPAGVCMISMSNPGVFCAVKDDAECQELCKVKQTKGLSCTFSAPGNKAPANNTEHKGEKVPDGIGGLFVDAIKFILVGILNVVGWLFSIAATLFTWVVDPANISAQGTGVLQKQAVKDVWIMVRDLLNMTFILILLFAAFCTIFQVDKWNLKKVWLNILINALLVNFSYPIARFFIDVSNVAFYYFINNLFSSASGNVTSGGIFAMFGAASNIGAILKPENYANYDIAYLVTMIIVLFIMGMTLLVIAALFVVRLVALTILVMFSPIGFVGYIFPATSSFADKWWKNLFSYSFFAPVMIFGMAIALKVTEAIGKENMQAFKAAASAQAPADQTSFISSAAFIVIPIVILWATIGVAKSMGIEGADKVVDYAKKGGKTLAMNMSGGNWAKKNYDAFSASRKKRAEEIGKKRLGNNLGDRLNNGQDKFIAGFTGKDGAAAKRYDKRKETKNKDDIKDGAEANEAKYTAPALKNEINKALTTHPPQTDKEKMDFAINAKLALARGAKHESLVEDDIKADIKANRGNYATLDPIGNVHDAAKKTFEDHDALKPQLAANATAIQQAEHVTRMADWSATRTQHKDAMEKAKKAVETEEKRILQELKTKHLDALRKAVQVGEDLGKVKPR